jgi:hypothetical protein
LTARTGLVVREAVKDDSPGLFESSDQVDLSCRGDALQVSYPATTRPASATAHVDRSLCRQGAHRADANHGDGSTARSGPGRPLLDRERWVSVVRPSPACRGPRRIRVFLQEGARRNARGGALDRHDAGLVRPLSEGDLFQDPAPDIARPRAPWAPVPAAGTGSSRCQWYGSDSMAWNEGSRLWLREISGRLLLRYTSQMRFAVDVARLTPRRSRSRATLRPPRTRGDGTERVSILPAELKERLRRSRQRGQFKLAAGQRPSAAGGRPAAPATLLLAPGPAPEAASSAFARQCWSHCRCRSGASSGGVSDLRPFLFLFPHSCHMLLLVVWSVPVGPAQRARVRHEGESSPGGGLPGW